MKRMQNQTMPVKKQTWRDKATYVKKNWQLYLFFLMPGLLLTSFLSIFLWEDF